MSIKYCIGIEKYAERHFIKSFEKKYSRAWNITITILIRELQSFSVLLDKSIAEIINRNSKVKICKVEFKIAGSDQSRHGSGNRLIVAVHEDTNTIKILFVYHKNHLKKNNETIQWKEIIKKNYPEYRNLLR